MSNPSFIKVTAHPEIVSGVGVTSTDGYIHVSAILALKAKGNNAYEVAIKQEYFGQIQEHFFHRLARLKNITAIIKDESVLL